jgi:peptidoglycan/xylan/chitin deacetylase (PgdA/CDA1 family)
VKIRGIGRVQRIARSIRNMFVARAIILLYHRVTALSSDPQLLCVSPRNFAEHLEVLRKCGRTVQVKELGKVLQSGNRGDCAVIVSFDDGYADNLYNAKPALERYDVPATVFVTAGHLGSKKEFWYDGLERIFLHTGLLPERLHLKINQCWYQWELGSAVDCGEDAYRHFRKWNVSRKDDPTVRHRLYRSLFQILQPLPDSERRQVMEDLAAWAGIDTTHRPSHGILSPEEMIRLADGGLIEIGSHTVSHPVLAALPVAAQIDEISGSKARLEQLLGHPVPSFAYPFGGRSHYTDETVAAVREAGFECACSNFPGVVEPGTDYFQLPRFLVRDWDGEEFNRRLGEWLCV